MLRVIELFSGIGSQREALKRANIEHEVIAISDNDKYVSRAYELLHGKTNNLIGMVAEVESSHILNVSNEKIRSVGISRSKIDFIKSFCSDIKTGKINFNKLNKLNDEDLIKTLTKIKGVGEWTAEMIALFSLGRENIFLRTLL